MNNLSRVCILFFLCILVVVRPLHALTPAKDTKVPEVVSSLDPEMVKLIDDLDHTKKSILDDEEKKRKVLSSLYEINKKLKKLTRDRNQVEADKYYYESQTQVLAQKILDLDSQIKSQKKKLRERLLSIYKLGGQGLARFLFSVSSPAQLDQNVRILTLVAKRDMSLMKDYAANKKDLASKKTKFTRKLEGIKVLEKRLAQAEGALRNQNRSKFQILSSLKSSQKIAIDKMKSIKKSHGAMAAADNEFYELLSKPSLFEKKGELQWPLALPILTSYGIRKHEGDVVTMSKGLEFLSVQKPTEVKAVFPGEVIVAETIEGLGHTLILDHGDHYYTVYANLERLQVELGQTVKNQQLVGFTGPVENAQVQGHTSLYFELRHFSEPLDPKPWFINKSSNIAKGEKYEEPH